MLFLIRVVQTKTWAWCTFVGPLQSLPLAAETSIFDVPQTWIGCTSVGGSWFEFWSRGMLCGWVDTQKNIPPTPSVGWLWRALFCTRLAPVIELVSMSGVSPFGVGWSGTWNPWMPFVCMFAVAVFVRVAAVEAMLGATEFHLTPPLSGGIFLHGFLVLVVKARLTGVCNSGGNGAGPIIIHFEDPNFCQKFLVLQVESIQLFTVTDLLFIKESLALCICHGVGANCTGVSTRCVCLDECGDP